MEPNVLWHFQELFRRMGWIGEQQLKLARQMQAVEQQLQALEQQLKSTEQLLTGLNERPTTRIDKIEYHFEQLKVDTLAGTLQIGVAHGAGADGLIEELNAGQTASQDVKLGFINEEALYPRVASALRDYLGTGLYQDIEESARQAEVDLDPELQGRITQDLTKQIKERVMIYMKEIPTKEEADPAAEQIILDKLKADVRAGLNLFFENYGKENPA